MKAILGVHRKYHSLVLTAFSHETGFVAALDKACGKFINNNNVTRQWNQSTKSPGNLAAPTGCNRFISWLLGEIFISVSFLNFLGYLHVSPFHTHSMSGSNYSYPAACCSFPLKIHTSQNRIDPIFRVVLQHVWGSWIVNGQCPLTVSGK